MRYAVVLLLTGTVVACDASSAPTEVGDGPSLNTGVVIGQEVLISWDGTPKVSTRISGDRVVWEDWRDRGTTDNIDIYAYDVAAGVEFPITTNPATQSRPDVSGDMVVWVDDRNGNEDIYLFDMSTGTETQVTAHPSTQRHPAVSGEWIVWTDWRSGIGLGADIYKFHIPTGVLSAVTNDPVLQYSPSVSGDLAVWEDFDNRGSYDKDIYLGDLSSGSVRKLYPKPANQDVAHISGRRVTYRDTGSDPNGDVYLYDIDTQTETFVHDGPGWMLWPRISGDRIVWESRTDNAIYLYDDATQTTTKITDLGRDADISGNRIVYAAYRDGAYGVYMFEIESVIVPDVAYLDSRVDAMVASGGISNTGIAEALHALLGATANHVGAGKYGAAVHTLDAFMRLVTAQTGRGIAVDAAAELMDLAQLLIDQYQTP